MPPKIIILNSSTWGSSVSSNISSLYAGIIWKQCFHCQRLDCTFLKYTFCLFGILFGDRVSLCNSGWPWTCD
jgi:hypothetical protein